MGGGRLSRGAAVQFALVMMIAMMAGLYRDGFPALFPFMHAEFGVSRGALGMYVSLLYLVSAALAVFAGHMADRLGAKRALLLGSASLGVLILAHVPAPSFPILLALGVVAGVGFSIIGPGSNKVVSDRFSPSSRGTPMGMMFVGWSVGGLLGAVALPTIAQAMGWRIATLAMGLAVLLATFLFYLKYREVGTDDTFGDHDRRSSSSPDTSFAEGFRHLIRDRYILLLCISGFILGATSGTMATHFPLYLHLDLGYSEAIAGLVFAVLHAGSIAGRPTWGLINDRLLGARDRFGFLLIYLTTALVLLALGFISHLWANPPLTLILVLTFVAGFAGRGWPGVLFGAVARKVERARAGMAMGFSLIFVRLGITIAPPVFGLLADITGTYDTGWLVASAVVLCLGVALYFLGLGEMNTEEP